MYQPCPLCGGLRIGLSCGGCGGFGSVKRQNRPKKWKFLGRFDPLRSTSVEFRTLVSFALVLSMLIALCSAARAESGLHDRAAKLMIDTVCRGLGPCVDSRSLALTETAHTIVDVCLSEPGVPRFMCLAFVRNAGSEAGGKSHPACGLKDQECVRACDELPAGSARKSCAEACAIDQGVQRRSDAMAGVLRCNDGWSSRGPFQQKPRRIAECVNKLEMGADYDPHDVEQSTRCTIRKIRHHATTKTFACAGAAGNRWMIAMKRVGAGPRIRLSEAKPRRWVPFPSGQGRWFPAVKAVYRQRCQESGYAKAGLEAYRKCGKACRKEAAVLERDQASANLPRVL